MDTSKYGTNLAKAERENVIDKRQTLYRGVFYNWSHIEFGSHVEIHHRRKRLRAIKMEGVRVCPYHCFDGIESWNGVFENSFPVMSLSVRPSRSP